MKPERIRAPDRGLEKVVIPFQQPRALELKKILCPIDLTECSRKALQYAAAFGTCFDAEVILLHICEPPPPQVEILEAALMDTTLEQDAAEQLERLRAELGPEVKARTLIRPGGHPHKEIATVAEEFVVDLIVVGSHARSAFAKAFLGSNAEKLVRAAPCPVLIIKEEEHEFVPTAGGSHTTE